MGSYSSDALGTVHDQYNKGLYEDALRSCRQHLTWYRLCHQAHTIPFLKSETKESKDLLKIDIEALADIAGLLHRCYFHTRQSEFFPSALECLTTAIDDSRWRNKITYLRALWWLLDKDDRAASLTVISAIDIPNCEDPEILALYLEVSPFEMPFKTKVEVIDRIISNAHRESYVLQYTILKGIAYCLINDIQEGCQIMKEAISHYRSLSTDKKTSYGDYQLAHGLQILGQFEGEATIVRDSITQYMALRQEATEKEYTVAYFAEIEKSLGDCWSFLKEYGEAVNHYESSLKYDDADLTRVFLARAQVNLGDLPSARTILRSIESSQFNEHEYYDFSISWTILATRSLVKEDLETAKLNLKQTKSYWPIFISQRDSALIDLLETPPRKAEGGFKNLIKLLNRYVSLNPNLFGIGVDFNKIVEDVHAKEIKDRPTRLLQRIAKNRAR